MRSPTGVCCTIMQEGGDFAHGRQLGCDGAATSSGPHSAGGLARWSGEVGLRGGLARTEIPLGLAMALAVPAMSLPRVLTRSLTCGTDCKMVSHGMPRHSVTDHLAAPAGARTDTCCTTTVTGSVQQGPTDSLTVRGPAHLRLAESCQPGRIYASVSQERCNRLELRESPFTPHFVGVLHGIVVVRQASLTFLSKPYLRSIRSRNNWTASIV
jgi:hypothetical protein